METMTLTINGLWSDPNNWSEVPPGALIQADDVVIDKPSIVEWRRGQGKYGLLNGLPDKFYSYQGVLLAHYGNLLAYDSTGTGIFTEYSGSFDSPDGVVRPRSFEENRNFYLTSSTGILKLDSVTGTFVESGSPQGLGGTYTLTSPGFMPDQVQVAYRIIWGYVDANDNEIIGSPSQRMVVVNDTGATADVVQTWDIPDGVTTDWFYRVFRSGDSAGVNFPPDDELGQIKDASPTSAEITAGEVTFTDIVPSALRGATLYTSPSQQGILQSNEQPPFALDICAFRSCAFYFNTKLRNRYFSTLVSVGDNTLGGSFGYQTNNGDTHTNTTIDGLAKFASVVIQDLTYTADTAGVAGNDISITYTAGGTAGAEVVTVTSSDISVQIQTAVSTATQIETALNASIPASALISVAVTGTGSNAQVLQAQTFLEDGFDTTHLNVGMRVVGAGVVAGTTIVSIDSISAITVSVATTATATVALEFQDRFSINTMDYWAASTADYPNRQFEAILDQTPSENIEQTTLNLIQAINKDPNNSIVYAYYTTNSGELPGSFLLQEREIGGPFFYLTSSNGTSFSPTLPLLSQTQISDNDERQNRVYFSKVQQSEAVPIVNFLDVGSENFPIVRALANRDSIFVFKEEEGIFRITGTDASNFTRSLFNSSARIKAPESAVVVNNKVITFSDQNIIAVDESGVAFVSDPQIESIFNEISSPNFTNFESQTFGVSYETDRSYLIYTVSEPTDTFATQCFRFNASTLSWTRWIMNRSAGIVLPSDNKLYTGNPTNNYVYQERKNFNRTDYADEEIEMEIVASNGLSVELIDPDFILDQSDFEFDSNTGWTDTNVDGTITIANEEKLYARSPPGVFNQVGSQRAAVAGQDGVTFQWSFIMPTTPVGTGLTNLLFGLRDDNSFSVAGPMIFMFVNNSPGNPLNVVTFPSGNRLNITAGEKYFGRLVVSTNTVTVYLTGGPEGYENEELGSGPHPGIESANIRFNVNLASIEGGSMIFDDYIVFSSDENNFEDIKVGDLLKQDDKEAIITEIIDDTTVMVNLLQEWEEGSASVFQKIPGKVKWIPNSAENPGILKHFSEATFLFKNAAFYNVDVGFDTDINDSTDTVSLSATAGQGWGQFPWGERPWSVPGGKPVSIRTYIPLESQRASWLNITVENKEAYSNFALAGVTVQFEPMSSKQR